jgi:molybdopterin-guanine dinucleotide biosynthesis protein MobB
MSALPPVVSFTARSGTGKTTFLCGLIPALRRRGVRVMVVKHDVHGFEVDKPGKDTWRLRKAGARQVLISNAEQMALMADTDGDQPLMSLIEKHAADVELVLSEGYRRSAAPKILVSRRHSPKPFAPSEQELEHAIAVVSDHDVGLPHLPRLSLDDPEECADFLVERFVRPGAVRRPLTGVVLAGGHSKRMGKDKAWLEFRGRPILPQLVESLATVCEGGVTVVRASADQELPELPEGTRVVQDLLPERAALGGLYTGLVLAPTPFVFLTACDMPLVDPALVRWMLRRPPAPADVLLPVHEGRPQPMHAIYGHRCLGAIKEALLSGEFRMDGWHGLVRVERIPQDDWAPHSWHGLNFLNVNTPEDLERASQAAQAASLLEGD